MPNWYPSDDPIRDAERYLDDEMEYSRRIPFCNDCGDPIYSEHAYLDPDSMELYCTGCRGGECGSTGRLLLVCTENFMED